MEIRIGRMEVPLGNDAGLAMVAKM